MCRIFHLFVLIFKSQSMATLTIAKKPDLMEKK